MQFVDAGASRYEKPWLSLSHDVNSRQSAE
jgi:hypothetical protein